MIPETISSTLSTTGLVGPSSPQLGSSDGSGYPAANSIAGKRVMVGSMSIMAIFPETSGSRTGRSRPSSTTVKKYPHEGYRRLTYMMMDDDVVAVSPSSVYRILAQAGLLRKWNASKSAKGSGFVGASRPH